jgi:hypothetical protein
MNELVPDYYKPNNEHRRNILTFLSHPKWKITKNKEFLMLIKSQSRNK